MAEQQGGPHTGLELNEGSLSHRHCLLLQLLQTKDEQDSPASSLRGTSCLQHLHVYVTSAAGL